jgi:D-arginine dehydrogenase
VRALTAASRGLFDRPPPGFGDTPLLAPRGLLYLALPGQEAALDAALDAAQAAGLGLRRISPKTACARVPLLRPEMVVGAAEENEARDIDVAALHQGYLRGLGARGGRLVTGAKVEALERRDGLWQAATPLGRFAAPLLVNAAGAWADEVAGLAGLAPLGLTPKRRTAMLIAGPPEGSAAWPLIADIGETWYCRPEAGGKLLLSPADATPCPPCDARPEELDIALAVDRFERVMTLPVRRIEHSWAGLRSFAPDGSLIIGPDPRVEGFFWQAGQGGYGIQTAPAAARLGAALLTDAAFPGDIAAAGLETRTVDPARLLTAG